MTIRKRFILAILAVNAIGISAISSFAADHLDGPAVATDPAADINDVYAFMNPNDPDELILVATVMPLATKESSFSNAVTYSFILQGTADGSTGQSIDCYFRGKSVNCRAGRGLQVAGPVGEVNENKGMRVFAGLRDDPFFFDLAAFFDTVDTLVPQFSAPGMDFFEGLDTLAIVIGIETSIIDPSELNPIQKVYASTSRAASPGLGRDSEQVDRMGRPAINTALIDLLASTGLKDQYNQAQDVASWAPRFQSEIRSNLAALDTLDGVIDNDSATLDFLSAALVDDRLIIDISNPVCGVYLAVELGVPQCGGRTLDRDVIDNTFGVVVGPGVSDFVMNTSVFLDEFPFLGLPNSDSEEAGGE